MERNKNTRLIIYFIPAVITSFAFFQGDTTLAPAAVRATLAMVNWICFISLLFLTNFKKALNITLLLTIIVQFLYRNFHTAPGISLNVSGVLMTLLLCVFCFLKQQEQEKLYRWFRILLIVMSFLGIITVFSFLLGLGLPHTIADYYDETRNASYVNFYFSYLYLDATGIRLCGLFNEPGLLGTMLGLTLIIERMNLKKIGNIVMLIAGVMSLSLTFFLLLTLGVIMKLVTNKKAIMPTFVTLIVISIGVYMYDKDNVVLSYIEERTAFDKDTRSIGGHTREEGDFLRLYDQFNKSDNLLFGYGTGYCMSKGIQQTSSLKIGRAHV